MIQNSRPKPSAKPVVSLPDDDDLLKPHPDVTGILKYGPSFVYSEMRKGELPFVRLGADRRIRRGDLRAYIAARRVEAAS